MKPFDFLPVWIMHSFLALSNLFPQNLSWAAFVRESGPLHCPLKRGEMYGNLWEAVGVRQNFVHIDFSYLRGIIILG